jgi:hypothetical protein
MAGRLPITRAHPYTPKSGPFAGQTFTSRRQYGNVHAQLKGYASLAARQRAHPPKPLHINPQTLTTVQNERYHASLETVGLMRREGLSLKEASHRVGTTPETVRRYAGGALEKEHRRYRAKPLDRLERVMTIVATVPRDPVPLLVRRSDTASKIARHHAALRLYLNTGDWSALREFRGKTIHVDKRGYMFLTDLDEINFRARRGLLSFESIYAH